MPLEYLLTTSDLSYDIMLVITSKESEPMPRLLASECQTWSTRAACPHLLQLFHLGNLLNPNLNAASPTCTLFITRVEQSVQQCSHKHLTTRAIE